MKRMVNIRMIAKKKQTKKQDTSKQIQNALSFSTWGKHGVSTVDP